MADDGFVVVGRIAGLFGVKGWVRVFSHTEPRDNILSYSPWYLRQGGEWRPYQLADGQAHGKGVVAQLVGCDDRDRAQALLGIDIGVRREQLPTAAEGEYYWADLIGLQVITRDGQALGRIDHLFETGANDVMVVRGDRERLIPFTDEAVLGVDLKAGTVEVDWDPEF